MTQMTDRELLQWAAKAADCGVRWEVEYGCYSVPDERFGNRRWNPLTDDGDALRLAVKLGFVVDVGGEAAHVYKSGPGVAVPHGDDRYAATRRAIVRAAAEIGKAMPTPTGDGA